MWLSIEVPGPERRIIIASLDIAILNRYIPRGNHGILELVCSFLGNFTYPGVLCELFFFGEQCFARRAATLQTL